MELFSNILSPMLVLGGLGLLFGVLLSVASNVFAVEVDPKVEAVRSALPGANCGACGFPGCDGLALAIAEGRAPITACSVGGAAVAEKISDIMGVNAGDMEKEVATVLCQGNCSVAKDKYIYDGVQDCRAQANVQGGSKVCTAGCLGCGTCKDVCDFGAIEIIDGIAVIDKDKCTSCKKCISVCPKSLIELIPYNNKFVVKCKNTSKGKEVKAACETGCIGCQICVKNCPKEAITFENNLAKIDYSKCINCSICAQKCPTGAIYNGKNSEKVKAQPKVEVKTETEEA